MHLLHSSNTRVLFGAGLLALFSSSAFAQLPQTQLSALSPAGGKVGSTLDVRVASGANLEDLNKMVFNHPGIKAVHKPTPANTFAVTIAAGVAPGLYEARVEGVYGLSSPRTFVVGTLNEAMETEPNNAVEQAGAVVLNSVMNGAIGGAADIDHFKFSGKKGQRVLIGCQSAAIDSRLQATVEVSGPSGRRIAFNKKRDRQDPLVDVTLPADGAYVIKVYDFLYRGGADYFYRLSVGTGPHIDYVLPPAGVPGSTGKYTLFGRNLPGGQDAGVIVDGQPLQKLDVTITLPKDSSSLKLGNNLAPYESTLEGMAYRLKAPTGVSNSVLIQFSSSTVVLEKEPNNAGAQSQMVTVPTDVAGQFQARGDIDQFRFQAKAKDVYYIEAFGKRGGSSADPYLTVEQITKDAKGVESKKRIAALDDYATNLAPNVFDTISDDPLYRFQVPADGTYQIAVRDRYFESRGDAKLVYRVAIRKEDPDFQLVALPMVPTVVANQPGTIGTIALRKGGNIGVAVYAFRKDGFNGPIDVSVEGLPKGVICHGASIAAGQTNAQLIFTSAEDAPEWSGSIRVIGKSRIEDTGRLQAMAAAKVAFQAAAESLKASQAAAAQSAAALAKVNAALAKVKQEAAKSPKDKTISDSVAALEKATIAATGVANQTNTGVSGAQKNVAAIQAALNKAEVDAVQHLVHDAKAGTIVWNGSATVPAISRLSRTLGLSVLNEPAPYQVKSDVLKIEVNQGRQILVPVNLAKRTGFDNQVALTFVIPKNTKFQVANKPIPKGKNSELLRLFVPNNLPVGTHTVYLKSQGQVSYRRNLVKYEKTKAEQAAVAKAATAAAAVAKNSAAVRGVAVKKSAADADALKKAIAAKANAGKVSAASAVAVKQVAVEKANAEDVFAKTAVAAKAVAEAAAAAKKAAGISPGDKTLMDAYAVVQKTAVSVAAAVKQAEAAKAVVAKKLTTAEAAAKKSVEAVVVSQKAVTALDVIAKASVAAQAKADAVAKDADTKSKAAIANKAAVDKTVAAMEKVKPANINIYPPSTPLLVTVKRAPATITAAVPGGGALKRGAKIDVKVTVKRVNGFAGPVSLSLPLPPGVVGLTANAVTIPADKADAVISIQSAANTTEGQLANMVVRASMDFEGKAAVDIPIALKVAK